MNFEASDMNELKKVLDYIEKENNKILKTKIKDEIIKTQKKHIEEDVYNKYAPKIYIRTFALRENENILDISDKDNEIEIANITTHQGMYSKNEVDVSEIIETGEGYDFRGYGYEYESPRPFIENTIENMKYNKTIENTFKEAWNEKGIILE